MRRVTVALLLAAALAAAALVAAASSPAAEGGPKCSDITGELHNFPNSTTGTYTLTAQVQLAAPACVGKITYQLFVLTDAGTQEANLTGFSTEGNPIFQFASSDSTICIYATTSTKAGRVYDRAPDASLTPDCLALTAGIPGGGSGFQ